MRKKHIREMKDEGNPKSRLTIERGTKLSAEDAQSAENFINFNKFLRISVPPWCKIKIQN
jgi:hypothetical protein